MNAEKCFRCTAPLPSDPFTVRWSAPGGSRVVAEYCDRCAKLVRPNLAARFPKRFAAAVFFGLALAMLGGCATSLPELRASAPKHAGTFPAEVRALALCTVDALDARSTWRTGGAPPTSNRMVERPDGLDVTGFWQGSTAPSYELAMRRTEAGTRVEARILDVYGWQQEAVWLAVQRCGASASR